MAARSVGDCLTLTLSVETFSEPLDALLAEHFRQRAICDLLDRLAKNLSGARAMETARIILTYLREQLPLHIVDEERDLFQLLRNRSLASEAVEEALAKLHREHAENVGVVSLVIAGLERLALGSPPESVEGFVEAAHAFADAQRRHVAYVNSRILPLARTRLTRKDLGRLSRRMVARRQGSVD
ncbi:MAG TPA: hemerythrin domain-containing protein [Alphaproteobacteria bacterium]|nr:hemerythrin domain-containing protein [Alphaproteobacteria bacterium]